MGNEEKLNGLEIAVIGMSGRFPDAKNLDEFWINLKDGKESVINFSHVELNEAGIENDVISHPNYIQSGVLFKGREYFDASFFEYTPTQAKLMDPQMRIFHECAWEALEDAGYDPHTYKGLVGLFGGAQSNSGWIAKALLSGMTGTLGEFEAAQLIEKDFICAMVAYKLGLKGPCFSLNTACSTSLVAVHQASQALLNGECDLALAGGVSVSDSQEYGYIYQEGLINSSDGHCRAFDADSDGTIGGEGAGIVVLKRYQEAVQDRDHIYAVIIGSAINNDGKRKVGFTAPSVKGQVEVIKTAMQMAQVKPEKIVFIEAHGTGTVLGDPVELEGLRQAFSTDLRGYCGIGSVKTNIGHLDTAAGIAGFIKMVLALKNRAMPPSLNFNKPNPKFNFEKSPFYVNTSLKDWQESDAPVLAGVSSFGIGGTNVHVILKEEVSSAGKDTSSPSREHHLVILSAKTPAVLAKMQENIAAFLNNNRHLPFADIVYTLQVGRGNFPYKSMCVCSDRNDAAEILVSKNNRRLLTYHSGMVKPGIIFAFSGLGSQYLNMGLDLYRTEMVFRQEMQRCFQILKTDNYNLETILYPQNSDSSSSSLWAENNINKIEISQIMVFSIEYALAQLLLSWGIKPIAMIGYSFGEYVAACLSGVFTLKEALDLIISRGRLIDKVKEGMMLSVPLTREDLNGVISDEVSIAIDNGPSCIVSGAKHAVERLEKEMKKKKLLCMPINTSHAVHSILMEEILAEFKFKLTQCKLKKPHIPFISNVSGGWIKEMEATDPDYWARHLRETVEFAKGVDTLLQIKNPIFIEIGPGHDLSLLVRTLSAKESSCKVVNLLRHEKQKVSDVKFISTKLGQLWLYGVDVDWQCLYSQEKRYRLSLPKYPFEHQYHWIDDQVLMDQKLWLSHGSSKVISKQRPSRIPATTSVVPTFNPEDPFKPQERPDNGFKPHMLADYYSDTIDWMNNNDVFIVNGVLKGTGFVFIKKLIEEMGVKIIYPWPSSYPLRKVWEDWLCSHPGNDHISLTIRNIQTLEKMGADLLLLKADVENPDQMKNVVNQGLEWFGRLSGLIHSIYTDEEKIGNDTLDVTSERLEKDLMDSIKGLLTLEKALCDQCLPFNMVIHDHSFKHDQLLGGTVSSFLENWINRQNKLGSPTWLGVRIESVVENGGKTNQLANKDFSVRVLKKLSSAKKKGFFVISGGEVLEKNGNESPVKGTSRLFKAFKEPRENLVKEKQKTQNPLHLITDYTPPRDKVDQRIVEIWQEILGFDQIGIFDNFFDLNGSSLTATQVISRVRDSFPVEISLKSFLENPTVDYLSGCIKGLPREELAEDL